MSQREQRLIVVEKKKFKLNDLMPVSGMTANQGLALDSLLSSRHTCLIGSAGTGKTFLALYAALRKVLDPSSPVSKVVVVRSAVAVRDIGFLPGTEDEKMAIYELPYSSICTELLSYKSAWSTLKRLELASFMSTSYVRGITLDDTIVIVDEAQNLSAHELDSVASRLGCNSELMICGDYIQSDLRRSDRAGFKDFLKVLTSLNSVDVVSFEDEDIVRSGFVKEYIIARNKIGLDV